MGVKFGTEERTQCFTITILRFHVRPMGVKFGTEEGTQCPLLSAKFNPHRCNDKGVGPQKLKFLL